MAGYIIKGGKYVRSGGKLLRGTDCNSCEFVELLKCSDNSESGFWLSTSGIPDGKTAAKYSDVCYYLSDPQLCVPDGDTLLDPGDVTFEDDCDACGGTPCYYKLVPCPGLFSEALLVVACDIVPSGKTSVIIDGICYVLDEQVDSIPDGYTVATPSAGEWSVDCPTCTSGENFDSCANACARCPATFTVSIHYHNTDGYTVDATFAISLALVGSTCVATATGTVTTVDDETGTVRTGSASASITCFNCGIEMGTGIIVSPGFWTFGVTIQPFFDAASITSTSSQPCPICVCCFAGGALPNPFPSDIDVWDVSIL